MTFLQIDELTLFWTGWVVLLVVLYRWYSRRKGLPPGPAGLPILGCYLSLRKDPLKALNDMGKKYGNIFGFNVGPQYLVVLNDWDATTEVYSQGPALYRPPELFKKIPYNFGISGISGPEWTLTRRLTSKAMKDIGLNRTRWEELIQEEVSQVIDVLLKHGEGPLDAKSYFAETFANNIMTLVLGERLPTGHAVTNVVKKSVDIIMKYSGSMELINFSPRLRKFFEAIGMEEKFLLPQLMHDFSKLVSDTVDEKVQTPNRESEDSFIDQFHGEVQRNKLDTDSALKGNVVALLTGGSETSRTTFIWMLIAMADHQEIQEKVHDELDKVIGKDGYSKWSDRSKVPYTMAVIMETMRWQTVIPINALRMLAEDITVKGYVIPKGSFITSNNWAIHNDPRYWKEPEKFSPERFLLDDGKKVNVSPESYIPFSYGKRNCPGQLIAMMEILQFFTSIMQKFKVVPAPKDGKKVKYDTVFGLSYQASNVELCFIPRQ